METGKYFVFGKKEKIQSEGEIIFIGKDGDFPSLEKYLEKTENHEIHNFTENHLDITYFRDEDTFISYQHEFPLDLRLEEPYIPRKSLVIVEKKKKLQKVIEDKYEYTQEDYDIFSGEPIKNITKELKIKILSQIVLLSKVLYQFLDAGYLKLESNKKVDDWIILFQEPILDILIRYHRIFTSASDIPTADEFIINPQFRKMISNVIMKILSNFVVNNNYVKIKDISKYESWENPEMWYYMKEKVKIFKI